MSNLLHGLLKDRGILVMESEEVAPPVEETAPDQIDTDSVADEIVSDISAADSDVAAVEETEEATATLESMLLTLESSLGNGGVTAREAGFAQLAGGLLVKQMGLEPVQTLATEHFGGIGSRYESTKVVMESFGEKVKEAYGKFVEWLKSMMVKMKDLWVKVKQFVRGLVSQIDKAMVRVKELPSEKSIAPSFPHPSLGLIGQYLLKKGETSFAKLPDRAEAIGQACVAVYGKYVSKAVADLSQFGTLTDGIASPDLDNSLLAKMPGNVSVSENGEELSLKGYHFVAEGTQVSDKIVGVLLTKSELISILNHAKLAATTVTSHEKNWSAMENALSHFETYVKSSEKEGATDEEKAKIKADTDAFIAKGKSVYTFSKDFTSYTVLILKNLVKYVDLVVSHWGGAPVAAPEGDKA